MLQADKPVRVTDKLRVYTLCLLSLRQTTFAGTVWVKLLRQNDQIKIEIICKKKRNLPRADATNKNGIQRAHRTGN